MKRIRVILLMLIVVIAVLMVTQLMAQDEDMEPLANIEDRLLEIRDLAEVAESDVQILDITSTASRLNFIGTIPLACTVVFGTTTEFGNASIDLDMNGGAIIEHNPLMLDLEPDTEYFYRVQGSAEDGTIYVGEVSSFRTLSASEDTSDNLLSPQNGTVVLGVSSNFGGAENDANWGILSAFDGNINRAWASAGDGDDAWFEVQLDGQYQINTLEFLTRLMSDGTSQIFEFSVTTDSGEVYNFELPEDQQMTVFEVDFVAETLRIDVIRSSGGNTGIDEIAVYGDAVE